MAELKPCAHCGADAARVVEYAGSHFEEDDPRWHAGCPRCTAGVDAMAKDEAIAGWNKRTPELLSNTQEFTSPLAEAGDRLAEAMERSREGWANAVELGLIPPQHRNAVIVLEEAARQALAYWRKAKDNSNG